MSSFFFLLNCSLWFFSSIYAVRSLVALPFSSCHSGLLLTGRPCQCHATPNWTFGVRRVFRVCEQKKRQNKIKEQTATVQMQFRNTEMDNNSELFCCCCARASRNEERSERRKKREKQRALPELLSYHFMCFFRVLCIHSSHWQPFSLRSYHFFLSSFSLLSSSFSRLYRGSKENTPARDTKAQNTTKHTELNTYCEIQQTGTCIRQKKLFPFLFLSLPLSFGTVW